MQKLIGVVAIGALAALAGQAQAADLANEMTGRPVVVRRVLIVPHIESAPGSGTWRRLSDPVREAVEQQQIMRNIQTVSPPVGAWPRH